MPCEQKELVLTQCLFNFRQVFERVIHLKLPAKKIKFFFKKYIDFEEKFGSHETMNEVKEKALEYVETKMDVDS